jgi:hypothetical protein
MKTRPNTVRPTEGFMPAKSSKGLRAFKVTLNPDVKPSAFEKFMATNVLENTITFRDGHSSQDALYARKAGGKDEAAYIWVISRTPSIDGSFSKNADAPTAFKALKSKVEEFGSVEPL